MESPVDPIYAAIADCRAAILAFGVALEADVDMETLVVDELRAAGCASNMVVATAERDPRYAPLREETARRYNLADSAALALLAIKPTTIAGAAALLRLAFEPDILAAGYSWPCDVTDDTDNFEGHDYFAALANHVADALEAIAPTVSS